MGNVFTSAAPVLGKAFLESILNAYATRPAGALLGTLKVRMSQDSGFSPTPADTPATLSAHECDFTGYTAGGYALTPGAIAVVSINGECLTGHVLAEAVAGSPFKGNVVYGYWIDDGTNVIQAEAFGGGNAIAVSVPGAIAELNLRIPLMFNQEV